MTVIFPGRRTLTLGIWLMVGVALLNWAIWVFGDGWVRYVSFASHILAILAGTYIYRLRRKLDRRYRQLVADVAERAKFNHIIHTGWVNDDEHS